MAELTMSTGSEWRAPHLRAWCVLPHHTIIHISTRLIFSCSVELENYDAYRLHVDEGNDILLVSFDLLIEVAPLVREAIEPDCEH